MKTKLIFTTVVLLFVVQVRLFSETGDDNPTGVAGSFNGEITTGGMYDGYTGNAKRVVDDIVVPGSVGAYPLKWTRYFNSHLTYADNQIGGAWRFSYLDYKHFMSDDPPTPDGRRISSRNDYGVEESVGNPDYPALKETLFMSDGGQVKSNQTYFYLGYEYPTNFTYPVQIIDPYGQTTSLSWVLVGFNSQKAILKLDRVTEPGGRYLQINWDTTNSYITSVQAFDGIAGHTTPIQSVTYTWTTFALNWNVMPSTKVLSRVDYSDGTFATYTYTDQAYPGPPTCDGFPQGHWHAALLK